MWYDFIKKYKNGYLLNNGDYGLFTNDSGKIITKDYWDCEQVLQHTYNCKWYTHIKPSSINTIEEIECICNYRFTTHGILYSLGEYIVYSDDDVECLNFEYIFVEYDNE